MRALLTRLMDVCLARRGVLYGEGSESGRDFCLNSSLLSALECSDKLLA